MLVRIAIRCYSGRKTVDCFAVLDDGDRWGCISPHIQNTLTDCEKALEYVDYSVLSYDQHCQ